MSYVELFEHKLTKTDSGWNCAVCQQNWKGKPGKTCPGCRVVSRAERQEKYLIREDYRKSENLRLFDRTWAYPRGNNWEISYNSGGKTAPFYPDCELKQFNCTSQFSDSVNYGKNSLKDVWGLAKINLIPGDANPVCCYWDRRYYKLLKLYRIKNCQVKDPSLPPVLKNVKPNIYSERELEHYFNLEPIDRDLAVGCLWSDRGKKLKLYYKSADCRVKDSNLPQVYIKKDGLPIRGRDRNGELVRGKKPKQVKFLKVDKLRTAYIWEQMYPLYQVKPDAKPRGCLEPNSPRYLYAFEDLEIHNRETYLSKTKLKQNYHLPPSLIKLLGKPDKIKEFEINGFWVEGQMYSRARIELMISQNEAVYLKHLQRYKYPLPILQEELQNLGEKKARAHKLKDKLNYKERLALSQLNNEVKNEDVIAQVKKCLTCASSLASPLGFICVIHPKGIGVDKVPCPDWRQKC